MKQQQQQQRQKQLQQRQQQLQQRQQQQQQRQKQQQQRRRRKSQRRGGSLLGDIAIPAIFLGANTLYGKRNTKKHGSSRRLRRTSRNRR